MDTLLPGGSLPRMVRVVQDSLPPRHGGPPVIRPAPARGLPTTPTAALRLLQAREAASGAGEQNGALHRHKRRHRLPIDDRNWRFTYQDWRCPPYGWNLGSCSYATGFNGPTCNWGQIYSDRLMLLDLIRQRDLACAQDASSAACTNLTSQVEELQRRIILQETSSCR